MTLGYDAGTMIEATEVNTSRRRWCWARLGLLSLVTDECLRVMSDPRSSPGQRTRAKQFGGDTLQRIRAIVVELSPTADADEWLLLTELLQSVDRLEDSNGELTLAELRPDDAPRSVQITRQDSLDRAHGRSQLIGAV